MSELLSDSLLSRTGTNSVGKKLGGRWTHADLLREMYPGCEIMSCNKTGAYAKTKYRAVVKLRSGKWGLVGLDTKDRDHFVFTDAVDFADSVRSIVSQARFFDDAEALRTHLLSASNYSLSPICKNDLLKGLPAKPVQVQVDAYVADDPIHGPQNVLVVRGDEQARHRALELLRDAGLTV